MLLVLVLLLAVLSVPRGVYAQEPYILSREVQSLAVQHKIIAVVAIEPAPQYISRYLDFLTAIDVMALERAKQRDRRGAQEDYPIVFAATTSWPNKPPTTDRLRVFILSDVRGAFGGSYLSRTKRDAILKAMRSLLLKGSLQDVIAFLTNRSMRPEDYLGQILDIGQIK